MSPTRRQFLAWGGGLTLLAAAGGTRRILVAPEPSGTTASVDELAEELYEALGVQGRAKAFFPYDHPRRQFHNAGLPAGGSFVTFFPRRVRQLVVDLVHASLSEKGRMRVGGQQFLSYLSLHATHLLLFGNPQQGPWQIHLPGPHLYLRVGGRSTEGVAFGGPQVWGDQRGNAEIGLPGNMYRDQLALGQALFAALPDATRKAARVAKAPAQTAVTVQGQRGRFDGVPAAELPIALREKAKDFLAGILDTYAASDAGYAWECIDRNGGIEAFHLADYDLDHEGGRHAGNGPSQIFRLESPAAVFHWRGEPHLHAFLNLAMDGEQPLSVGEVLFENPAPWGNSKVRAFFEEVMAAEMGTELAYYPEVAVAGRLPAGTIRTGDIMALESWENRIDVLEVIGADLAPPLRARLGAHGKTPSDERRHEVAVPDYVARHPEEFDFAGGRTTHEGVLVRDAAISHLRNARAS